ENATYYARLTHRYSGLAWDHVASRMIDNPSYANTAIPAVNLRDGRIGYVHPAGVPAGKYHLTVRTQAGESPALTDVAAAPTIDVRVHHDGRISAP
ncbi:MAG: hypothetical protein ABFE01_11030, partial [Phycisphaerales bacterium]